MRLRVSFLLVAVLGTDAAAVADVFEHVQCEALSLAGTWEMAYRPDAWRSEGCPAFDGVWIDAAVPGYWEDMTNAFAAAGLDPARFRTNPQHVEQHFPMTGWAKDTTVPNPFGSFLYRRTFVSPRTDRAVLAFDCVRNEVGVWINGGFVAFRQGFSTPFELSVPDGLLRKGTNEIVLAVANVPNVGYNGREVTGLTTRGLFGATGGIDGRIELRFPRNDLGDVCVTTASDLKRFTIHVPEETPYAYSIRDGDAVVRSGKGRGDLTLPTEGLSFWSPESPKLYCLELKTAVGSYSQRFGLRRLTAEGERLKLNGRPVYLRGVTEHAYFAKTTHVPRDLAYWRMVTAKRKELGFNFVRFHTFVPPVEYLEATDALGMLVHIETPNFVPVGEYAAIVAFARRHPSVVLYCTGNETQIDETAEAYLEEVAALVHRETDALFTPMSALRGIEYFIREGQDPYVNEPLPHNAERIARMSRYCDLFTSYQLGVASYSSLSKGSSELLDRWGDAYGGKPRLSHETCIDSSYVDFSTEALYPPDSPVLRAGIFSRLRDYLSSRGTLEKSDLYFRNSCEWMRRIRKFTFEKLRAADRVAGFDFLGDINTHWHTFGYSVGMMDEFYRLKPGESIENVRRYNSAAVLLCDLGSDFNVTAGTTKRIAFTLSNYAADAPSPVLEAGLYDAETGAQVASAMAPGSDRVIPAGRVSSLTALDFAIPDVSAPRKYLLKATFAGGLVRAANEWEVYAFPRVASRPAPRGVRVVTDISTADLLTALARGERVVLFGVGPFRSLPTTYRIGMAGRCSGNFATVVKNHPTLAGFPHEGFCGWPFRRLMEGGRAVQLEADVPFDPVVDIASSVKHVIRQSALFEYRVGDGRLLVCSFALSPDDPAAVWLKNRLVDYAASEKFVPEQALTQAQLQAVIAAPLETGEENTNEARNANDPASVVGATQATRIFESGREVTIEPLPGERWRGGTTFFGNEQPYVTTPRRDLANQSYYNPCSAFFVSSAGRYVWSDRPFCFSFSNGVLRIDSSLAPVRLVQAGSTLREAYLAAVRAHFPPSGRLPDEVFFSKPQFNTWIESNLVGNGQEKVEQYVEAIVSNRFPCGVLMIDDGWAPTNAYGDLRFNESLFPEPKRMFARIREQGIKTMLWTTPYIFHTAAFYQEASEKGLLLKNRLTGETYEGTYWRTLPWSGILDLVNRDNWDVLERRYRVFADAFGFDGYKFDFTDAHCLLLKSAKNLPGTCLPGEMVPAEYTGLWGKFASRFVFNEMRAGWQYAGLPLVCRLQDKNHNWEDLRKLVPDMLAAGMLGCAYTCPDMIGGGNAGDFRRMGEGFSIDEKLFVRSAQVQALMPMMQFSAAPWRLLSEKGAAACRAAADLHVAFAPRILSLARAASKTGEPIVRPMDYVFPRQGFDGCLQQFMLGDDLLVAPVVSPGDDVTVRLPAGAWRDDRGVRHVGPVTLELKDVPLERLPWFERCGAERTDGISLTSLLDEPVDYDSLVFAYVR